MIESDIKTCKQVHFEESVSLETVQSHCQYSLLEHRSVWYSKEELRGFRYNEKHEKLTAPMTQRKERRQWLLRINNIRNIVLQAQSNDFLQNRQENSKNHDVYVQWLSEIYSRKSEPFSIKARQRGLENDLELLNFKIQDMTTRLSKRSPFMLCDKMQVSKIVYKEEYKNKNNALWDTSEAINVLRTVPPNASEKDSPLCQELCKDLFVKSNETNTSIGQSHPDRLDRWSPVPRKAEHERRGVIRGDIKQHHISISVAN